MGRRMSIDMCVDMCTDMRVEMLTELCLGMYIGMLIDEADEAVCGHAFRRVSGHACRHVRLARLLGNRERWANRRSQAVTKGPEIFIDRFLLLFIFIFIIFSRNNISKYYRSQWHRTPAGWARHHMFQSTVCDRYVCVGLWQCKAPRQSSLTRLRKVWSLACSQSCVHLRMFASEERRCAWP